MSRQGGGGSKKKRAALKKGGKERKNERRSPELTARGDCSLQKIKGFPSKQKKVCSTGSRNAPVGIGNRGKEGRPTMKEEGPSP